MNRPLDFARGERASIGQNHCVEVLVDKRLQGTRPVRVCVDARFVRALGFGQRRSRDPVGVLRISSRSARRKTLRREIIENRPIRPIMKISATRSSLADCVP